MSVARVLIPVLVLSGSRLTAQPAPADDIQLSLRKLNELGTVLMIAAHPDDERTNILAYFARGRHMRTAYLSITRGEGGQNLIGSEQGAALGLIRTQELLAARRIDGAEQFFTRAIDFGFTKTVAETMQKWGHDSVLSDVVWMIRRYRPDVIILGFSGTPSDGHGQHQASAILGKEGFEAAGDPARFPEQLKYVQPWHAAKVVTVARGPGGRGPNPPTTPPQPPVAPPAQISTAGYSPFLGYTYDQLAALSRSQHRSQGLGAFGLGAVAGFGGRGGPGNSAAAPAPPPSPDLFEGIDHSWNRLPGGAAVGAILSRTIHDFDAEHPEKSISQLGKARSLIAAIADPLVKTKLAEVDELIGKCAGIWAEAQARQAEVAPGSRVTVAMSVYARLPVPVTVESIRPEGNWSGTASMPLQTRPGGVSGNIELDVPAEQPYSQPYWLRKPPVGGRYTVDDQTLVGRADTPVERIHIQLTVAGIPIELSRAVENRFTDRAEAERIRPLTVIPAVAVNPSFAVSMFPASASRTLHVVVQANVAEAEGDLRLDLPEGWKAQPPSQPFRMAAAGEERELSFAITPPAGDAATSLRAIATVRGREIAVGMQRISYAHIPVQTLFPPSDVKLVRSDIRVTAHRVGYIMGAGDEVADALRQLGLEVTMLSDSDLMKGDLTHFDAIVAGVRAYNVRPELRANHARLLDYVKNGGTYVVQYVTAGVPNIGPYPITIPGGNANRITVEDAPVTFTHPDSPLLQMPNRIQARDFQGWIQERGLNFPTQWDPHYETVLASSDPGEKPLEGGELWTRYGKGVYVFSCYSWFRQLPAGVPGAYRLFANMLSAK